VVGDEAHLLRPSPLSAERRLAAAHLYVPRRRELLCRKVAQGLFPAHFTQPIALLFRLSWRDTFLASRTNPGRTVSLNYVGIAP
jgi:hypothetical protein